MSIVACAGTESSSTPGPIGGGAAGVPYATGGVSGSSGAFGSGGVVPSNGGASAVGGSPIGVGGAGAPNGGAGTPNGGASGASNGGASGASSGGAGGSVVVPDGGPPPTSGDPGTAPWTPVPQDQILSACKLAPDKLAAAEQSYNFPWAVVRYGKLCYQHNAANFVPAEAWSTTKTLGALVAGVVSYQTRAIPRTGKKTGQFSDEDRVDQWLDAVTYNPEAHVAHVLAMVAHNANLGEGQKAMAYDTVGNVQINSLSQMLNAAIAQDTGRLGANLEAFTQKFVFGALGMTKSSWSGGTPEKTFAFSWTTDVLDMARVGLLILHHGIWSGQRILDEEWTYRMTHPSFEDANTGYGYLTWLNASSNFNFGGIPLVAAPLGADGKGQTPYSPGPCAPVSVYKTHPHGLSTTPDCHYNAPYSCTQQYDVGVWQAEGLGGQIIQGHPGLDLLLIVRDAGSTGPDAPKPLWDALRPAVVAADPTYKGDDAAFCAAYGANKYAPDL